MSPETLLSVNGLAVEYGQGRTRSRFRAVSGVSFDVAAGETVGLVGESGSGKTTIGRAILGLAHVAAGSVEFDGRDITALTAKERRGLSADLQVIFQDPNSSLNPARTIGETLAETLRPHPQLRANASERAAELLEQVGLPKSAADRYPAQFSGGQRQRIAVARALMAKPRLLICDEAVSALDLSIQGQVLNLLQSLQRQLGVSYLFISHDLTVVRHVSRRIAVLYLGQIMEIGSAEQVYERPVHPYTRMLLDAEPLPDPAQQRARAEARTRVKGEATRAALSAGCPFSPRCAHATDLCRTDRPKLESHKGRNVACHYADSLPAYTGPDLGQSRPVSDGSAEPERSPALEA